MFKEVLPWDLDIWNLKFEIGIDFWKNWGKTFVYEGGEKMFQSSGNYWKLRKCQGIIL